MNVDTLSCWNGLVEQRQMLIRVLKRRCVDRSIAEDLAHDTLLRAARYRPSHLDLDRVPAWLQRIAMNVLNDHLRREYRCPRPEGGGEEQLEFIEGREQPPGDDLHAGERYALGEASLCREDALRHMFDNLQGLNDRDRRALSRAYVGTATAVVDETETRAKRKARLFRARRRLRRAILESAKQSSHATIWRAGGES